MKRFSVTIVICGLACASSYAQPTPKVARWNSWGPRTVFAGTNNWYEIDPRPSFVATCDGDTDLCTSDRYQAPLEKHLLAAESTGTLPGGIETYYGTRWPTYNPCQISGQSFKLCRANAVDGTTGQAVDITSARDGTLTFYLLTGAGTPTNLYPKIKLTNPAGTGFPAGVTFVWRVKNVDGCDATPAPADMTAYDSLGWCTHMAVAADVPPGTYSGSFHWCSNSDLTNCSDFPLSFTVIPVPEVKVAAPKYFPPIAGLDVWKRMLTEPRGVDPIPERGGGYWCPDPANGVTNPATMAIGWEGGVWYYDGAAEYYRMADLLGDQKWSNCGDSLVNWYAGIASTSSMQKHRMFVDGLGIAAARHPDKAQLYHDAVTHMLAGNSLVMWGPRVNPSWDRENAYALDLMVGLKKYFGESHARYADQLTTVINAVLSNTEPVDPYGYQSFMMGLQLHALIYAYEQDPDRRAFYAIQRGLDDLATHYSLTTHAPYYNTGALGSGFCGGANTWFNADAGSGCRDNTKNQVLDNLIAHAFAWMWRRTGDDKYRAIGDDAFAAGTQACCWTGKEFSQNYRFSFDFVRWRSGPNACPVVKMDASYVCAYQYDSLNKFWTGIGVDAAAVGIDGTPPALKPRATPPPTQ